MRQFVIAALIAAWMLVGCNLGTDTLPTPAPTPDIPTVEILSPPNNQQVIEGIDFEFDIVARDEGAGIARMELLVDGAVVNEARPVENDVEAVFRAVMNWRATTPGLHLVEAIAYRADDTPSDPASINIEVLPRES